MPYKWTLLLSVPQGHHYFRDELSGRYAMSSRMNPALAEEGILWFDTTKPLKIELSASWVPVPVLAENDRSVGVAGENIAALADVLPLWQDAGGRIELVPTAERILRAVQEAVSRQQLGDLAAKFKKNDPT